MAPSLGGLVYARAGYNAVIGMCAGLIAVDVFLRLVVVEKKVAERFAGAKIGAAPDPPGHHPESGALIPSGESAVDNEACNINATRQQDEDNPAAASFGKPKRPPLLLRLILNARFASAFYGFAIFVIVLTGFDAVLAIRVKHIYHWGPIRAGTIYLTLGLPCLAGPPVGYIGDRIGPRWLVVAGLGSTSVLLVLLGFLDQNGLDEPYILVLVLTGIGIFTGYPKNRHLLT